MKKKKENKTPRFSCINTLEFKIVLTRETHCLRWGLMSKISWFQMALFPIVYLLLGERKYLILQKDI